MMQTSAAITEASSFLLSLSRNRILIADPDTMERRLAAATLGAAGYSIRTAPDSDTALELVEMWAPRLLVLDLDLPDIGGEALACMLKAHPHLRAIPVIAVANPDSRRVRDLHQANFSAVMSKPLHPESFVRRIAAILHDASPRQGSSEPGAGPLIPRL